MADTPSFLAICKKEFIPIVADNDELPISNLGALELGFKAKLAEDASDFTRANQLWAEAKALLAAESQDDEGAGAQGVIQVSDDFCVSEIGGWP